MNTIDSGSGGLPLTEGSKVSPNVSQAMLKNRIRAFRGVILSLLTEIESLTNGTEPTLKGKLSLDEEVKQFEIDLIVAALLQSHGNQSRAAQVLGLKPTTLHAKIKRYQIPRVGFDFAPSLLEDQPEPPHHPDFVDLDLRYCRV